MPEVISDLEELPLGAHCLSLHADRTEAADHAVRFLAGTPEGKAPSFWVTDPGLANYYSERLVEAAPACIGCVHVLEGEQVSPMEGKLRPAPAIREFLGAHPGGVSAGADTISQYWTSETVPEHLEYEAWFQEQPREESRFICPYDLRRIPQGDWPRTLRELGSHHTHVSLSRSSDPGARLLELFVFGTRAEIPKELAATLLWARVNSLVVLEGESETLQLTSAGEAIVQEWSRTASVDW
ncbi:MAG: hypothetical protein ACREDK_00655 [Thermoplasmata archaeon]